LILATNINFGKKGARRNLFLQGIGKFPMCPNRWKEALALPPLSSSFNARLQRKGKPPTINGSAQKVYFA
jgi:hypothetical protein